MLLCLQCLPYAIASTFFVTFTNKTNNTVKMSFAGSKCMYYNPDNMTFEIAPNSSNYIRYDINNSDDPRSDRDKICYNQTKSVKWNMDLGDGSQVVSLTSIFYSLWPDYLGYKFGWDNAGDSVAGHIISSTCRWNASTSWSTEDCGPGSEDIWFPHGNTNSDSVNTYGDYYTTLTIN